MLGVWDQYATRVVGHPAHARVRCQLLRQRQQLLTMVRGQEHEREERIVVV